jgi:uncharacterized membrane protein YbjE (DUF340 family)
VLDLVNLVISLIAGIFLGYVLRNRISVKLDKVTFGVIIVLIFSLGFSIGSNNQLLASMPEVGLNALVISLLTIFFSVLFVKAGRKVVKV